MLRRYGERDYRQSRGRNDERVGDLEVKGHPKNASGERQFIARYEFGHVLSRGPRYSEMTYRKRHGNNPEYVTVVAQLYGS